MDYRLVEDIACFDMLCAWWFIRICDTNHVFAAVEILLTLIYQVTVGKNEILDLFEYDTDATRFQSFKLCIMLSLQRSKSEFHQVSPAHALPILNVLVLFLKLIYANYSKTIKRLDKCHKFKASHLPHARPTLVVYPLSLQKLAEEMVDEGSSMENLVNYEWSRYLSFQTWPPDSVMMPMRLSQAGFYYTGHGEVVKCFCCGVTNGEWARDDTAIEVHRRLSPDCRFVLEEQTNNTPIHSEEYNNGTFQTDGNNNANDNGHNIASVSPNSQNISNIPTSVPENNGEGCCANPDSGGQFQNGLAQSGFYFTGVSFARCFHCSDGMRNWQSSDEHFTRLSPNNLVRLQVQVSVPYPNLPNNDPVDNAELRQTVSDQKRKIKLLEEKNQRLGELTKCKICLYQEANIMFLPCGHVAACHSCARRCECCAICRAAIRGVRPAYLS